MNYLVLGALCTAILWAIFQSFAVLILSDSAVVITRVRRRPSEEAQHRVAQRGVTLKWPLIEKRSPKVSMQRRHLSVETRVTTSDGINFFVTAEISACLLSQAETLLTFIAGGSDLNYPHRDKHFGALNGAIKNFVKQHLTTRAGELSADQIAAQAKNIARELRTELHCSMVSLGITEPAVLITQVVADPEFEDFMRLETQNRLRAQRENEAELRSAEAFMRVLDGIMDCLKGLDGIADSQRVTAALQLSELWLNAQHRRQ